MLIVGDQEAENQSVSIRKHGGEDFWVDEQYRFCKTHRNRNRKHI